MKGHGGELWHCAGVQVTTTTRNITQVKVQLPGAFYCHFKSGHCPGAPQFLLFINSSPTPRTLWAPQGKAVTLIIPPRNSCPFFSFPMQKAALLRGGNSAWPQPSWGAALALPGGTPGTKPSASKESRKSPINIQHRSLHHSTHIILCGTCTVPMATSILHPTPLFRLFEALRISGAQAMAQSYFVLISLENRDKTKKKKLQQSLAFFP